ncbi:GNAT family N-acetyltransferase [Lysinibacillus sp. 54212]|uniref:GNAT family N-acetyltransferase n=1 Tax=Lysinibacillus sp. 54212 TaxID=3119829 RepID=UPI002FCA4406
MSIREISKHNKSAVTAFFKRHWGSTEMVISSGVFNCSRLDGFIYLDSEGEIIGLVTFVFREEECEIISLDSIVEGQGVGSQLLTRVEQEAIVTGCRKLTLITTNDNVHALKFYQKRGYRIVQILPDAVDEARKVKPTIPLIGNDGIPLKDELRLEKVLK